MADSLSSRLHLEQALKAISKNSEGEHATLIEDEAGTMEAACISGESAAKIVIASLRKE